MADGGLSGRTGRDRQTVPFIITAFPLHQIHDSLLLQYPEEHCTEQRVRRDLSVLEGLSQEGALSVRVESTAGAHNQRRYKAYHPAFGLNEARMAFDSISISRFLSPRQKNSLISQLEGYLSRQEVHQLRQRVQTRPCLMQNEQLLETLKTLYRALDARRCLHFAYCKFDLDGQQKPVQHYRDILPLKFDMFPAREKAWVTFRLHRDLLDFAFETFGTAIRPEADAERPGPFYCRSGTFHRF